MQLKDLSGCRSGFSRIALFFRGLVIMSVFAVTGIADGFAQGNLLILPRRVVFEGAMRTQDLTLANTGTDSAKYVVSIVQMRMKDDGSFESVTTPDSGQNFADQYLRFYPRTVKLAPKKSQTVKMQFVKAKNMQPGEYRSHIYFRSVPEVKPLGDQAAVSDSSSVTAKLVPIFGITIPVIIRLGASETKVSLSDLTFEMVSDTLPKLRMSFLRTGNFSVYGDIVVKHVSALGVETKVASVKGIAVYTPNPIRRFHCNLERKNGVDYKSGKLVVVFSTPIDTKLQKLAEAEILLK